MLGMRMEIRQRLALVCTACDKPSDTHDERCPTFHIDELLINEPTYYCEGACSGQVHVDTDDFLKCRECLTRYSLGMFADTENPRHVFLHRVRPDEEWVEAHVLAARGKRGGFKLDLKVKALREQEKIWRKRRRDEKAAARAARRYLGLMEETIKGLEIPVARRRRRQGVGNSGRAAGRRP